MWFRESESKISDIFDNARAAAPCIALLDELIPLPWLIGQSTTVSKDKDTEKHASKEYMTKKAPSLDVVKDQAQDETEKKQLVVGLRKTTSAQNFRPAGGKAKENV